MKNHRIIVKYAESSILRNDYPKKMISETYNDIENSLNINKKIINNLGIGFVNSKPLFDSPFFYDSFSSVNLRHNFNDVDNKNKSKQNVSDIFQFLGAKNKLNSEFIRTEEIMGLLDFYTSEVLIFNTKLSKEEILLELNQLEIIEHAEYDYVTTSIKTIKQTDEKTTSIDKIFEIINFNQNYEKNINSDNEVIVAVIDTGINYKHTYFNGSLWKDMHFKNNYFGINLSDLNKGDWYDVNDENGHGTHISGIINATSTKNDVLGIAKDTKLLTIKVNNSRRENFISDKINALAISYILGAQIINCSWYISLGEPEDKIKMKKFNGILSFLESKNCITIFAAANEDRDVKYMYPQNEENIIVVGAIDSNKKRLRDSCYGKNVTVWAPGEDIESTGIKNYNTILKSGTSIAAPFVTATIALLKQKDKTLNIESIKKILQKTKKEELGYVEINQKKELIMGHLLNINQSLKNIKL